MRLPDEAFRSRPWRIHELTPDFRLEDVWLLPGTGAADDFPRIVDGFVTGATSEGGRFDPTRILFAIRWKLGEWFGWDDPDTGVGSRVPSLRDRLPADLRAAPAPEFEELPFEPLYLTEDEFAAEIANSTVHGVLHLGRVSDGAGGFRAHMAVLVKPNGRLGEAYMLAIKPFRHLIVYPAIMRRIEREAAAH